MAKKFGTILLLCFAFSLVGISAFAAENGDNAQKSPPSEMHSSMSTVIFKQSGSDILHSTDEGKSWRTVPYVEEPKYFTYDDFSAWIENEAVNIQKLVDAGEWTEKEAADTLAYYKDVLNSISDDLMVSKRATSTEDQVFFSMPDTEHPVQYQTFVFNGDDYQHIGPFDTEEELIDALKDYADNEVNAGSMTPEEAQALLEKYK